MISPFLSIKELRSLIESNEFSVSELLDMTYARFARYDHMIGSALELFDKASICIDRKQKGSLSGIPGLLKDNICIEGRRMQCASRILEGYYAPYNATVSKKLMEAGALLIGRANMDEFAMGSSNETSAYQLTRNPWKRDAVPGGSSGGPVAAVAAGFVPWALGSETGGSVRQPAALCGIVGSKPTYGLVSRYGLTVYASSTDQIGVATRTVYDNALVLSLIAGQETPIRDATCTKLPGNYDITRSLTGSFRKGLKIGVITNAMEVSGIDPAVLQLLTNALEEFKRLGAQIVEVKLPSMDLGAATYFVISRAEASSNLARFDGVRYGRRSKTYETLLDLYCNDRSEGFGTNVQQRILVGNYVLSSGHADAYYRRACQARELMRSECHDIFATVDLLFAPVSPMGAFKIGEFAQNSLALDLQDYFTCFANLVGIPALSVPCGFLSHNLPMGFQLMGPAWSEERIFQVAYAYEQATPWHTMHPDLDAI